MSTKRQCNTCAKIAKLTIIYKTEGIAVSSEIVSYGHRCQEHAIKLLNSLIENHSHYELVEVIETKDFKYPWED